MAGLVDLTDLPGLNQYVDLYVTSDEDSDGIGEAEKMGGGMRMWGRRQSLR